MTRARQPITPADAARLYGTTVGYVYKLASLHRWRRIRDGRRIYYDLSEVDAILGK